jgi:hypothetical protein
MSTLAYAALTTSREKAPAPGTRSRGDAAPAGPGVKTYVDALAALVPAEVLSLHAVILSFTTATDNGTTRITATQPLSWAFWGLIALSLVLYVVPHMAANEWDMLDYVRMIIPPAAFVGWTMLQRATAFDAVIPDLDEASRTVIALFLAVVLGLLATYLAFKAEQKQPT